ncbi:carbamoyltransferase [bacterium]|nr:carbamoyltransferase [bacterium]
MPVILGISAFYHDSGAALIKDGKILAAAQEERFTRTKHDPSFPKNAIEFCLEWSGLQLEDLDAVVFYDKPLLKMERLLETYYAFAPRGLRSFLLAIPVWIKEKLFLRKMIRDQLESIGSYDPGKTPTLFPEHHLSHAASAFYPSPFQEAAILTIDGVGEWATASMGHGKGRNIQLLKELRFPHSVGLLYSAFTYYLGFKVNSGEYKLMGLAPYGNKEAEQTKFFRQKILEEMVDLKDDGSIWLNQDFFDYASGLRMTRDKKWENLFKIARREKESQLEQVHCNLAMAIQQVTEEIVLKMAREAQRITGSKNLVMAGGVALNCVANGRILREKIFDRVWIQPAAGDAGGALGAAYAVHHLYFQGERNQEDGVDKMQGSLLGPRASHLDVELMAQSFKAVFEKFSNFDKLVQKVATLLDAGSVVGWHQGRMEWGPRALGNRSILGDARNSEMQKKLNLKVKHRESFRPFAPSVLQEDTNEFFELSQDSPYMLLVSEIKESRKKPLPADYQNLPLKEKLYTLRSDLPAITHLDYSARIQTVHKETNPRYHHLLQEFKDLTGYGILVNTSFNVRGEPPVCVPEDSYRCFMRTQMDYLVIENYLFIKDKQPRWKETGDWKEAAPLD